MAADEDSQVYRDLMRFKPAGLTPNAWAVQAGVNRTVWADMRRHGNPSRRTLEKLLAVAGSSLAEFEALRIGSPGVTTVVAGGEGVGESRRRGWTRPSLPPLPLRDCALAGEWGESGSGIEMMELRSTELDRLPRPQSLAGDADAYAIPVVGDSMWPRFRPGRHVAVSPHAPVAIGDDVLVHLRSEPGGGHLVLLKELVRRSAAFVELRQFNPATTFRVDTAEVETVEKVAGEVI